MGELTRKALLEEQISDLEDSLHTLKEQLRKIEEQEQHQLIENLEDYFNIIDKRFENIEGFWKLLKEELSEMFKKDQK